MKWFLWHRKVKNALERLSEIKVTILDEKLLEQLQNLGDYLNRNKRYISHYQAGYAKPPFLTSTYAESKYTGLLKVRTVYYKLEWLGLIKPGNKVGKNQRTTYTQQQFK